MYYILLITILFFNIHDTQAFSKKNESFILKKSENVFHISSIGIADFRNILKNSITMKNIGKKFLNFEKKLNKKIKIEQINIKKDEQELLKLKNSLKQEDFKKRKKILKQRITKLQKFAFDEKNKLNSSFQDVQKKLKDILALVIREISAKRGFDIVVLKEHVFLYNNDDINFSDEALKAFDEKTKNLKITIVTSN